MSDSEEAASEAERIIAWLRWCIEQHEKHADRKGQITVRRHHIEACRWIITGIENDEHHAIRMAP